MNENTKKYLITLSYRAAFSLGLFLLLFALSKLMPELTEKISLIWTKNINLEKMEGLASEFIKELFPF